jgi:hypothetical protein
MSDIETHINRGRRWAAYPRIEFCQGVPRFFETQTVLASFLDDLVPIDGEPLPSDGIPGLNLEDLGASVDPSEVTARLERHGCFAGRSGLARRAQNRQNYIGVPVVLIADHLGPAASPALREKLAIEKLGAALMPFHLDSEIARAMDGHFEKPDGTWVEVVEFRINDAGRESSFPDVTWIADANSGDFSCCLGMDWQFLHVERDASRRAGHIFDGTRYGSVAEILVRALYDLEDAVFAIHRPGPPAAAMADLWVSGQVQLHIAKFCRELTNPANAPVVAVNTLHKGDWTAAVESARTNVYRRLAAIAHELRAETASSTPAQPCSSDFVSERAAALAEPSVDQESIDPNQRLRRRRGPRPDEEGHKRVTKLLAPNWKDDLPASLRALAQPADGGDPVVPSRAWQKRHKIASYSEVFENIGSREIIQHLSRRLDQGRKLSATLVNCQ